MTSLSNFLHLYRALGILELWYNVSGIGRPSLNSLEKPKKIINMERLSKVAPFLLFLVPGLLAFVFFVKVHIFWEEVNIYWLMALIFHVPFLLFFTAAILMEIIDSMERKKSGLLRKNKLKRG